jgi:SAM-dependent methyltransferase
MSTAFVGQKNAPYRNKQRGLKEHEKCMLRLVGATAPQGRLDVLDVGCADGLFLEAVSNKFECGTVDGLDYDPEMVSIARTRDYRAIRSDIYLDDVKALTQQESALGPKRYDVIIASGILAFFEDQDEIVRSLWRHLNDDGMLFVFSKVISHDVDMRYAVRAAGGLSWSDERFLLSLASNRRLLGKYLSDVTVEHFELPFDLPAASTVNMHSSYTVQKADGSRMILTRHNVVAELAFLYGRRRETAEE